MSADNGIYIAKFPIDDRNNKYYEYHVAHVQNIEDCLSSDSRPEEVTDMYRVLAFGNVPVFFDFNKAQAYAGKLFDEIMNSECPIVEYGISELVFNKPIKIISEDKARKMLSKYYGHP